MWSGHCTASSNEGADFIILFTFNSLSTVDTYKNVYNNLNELN